MKKLLTIFQSGYGNTVLALPLFNFLKKDCGYYLVALTNHSTHKELLELSGIFDEIHLYQENFLIRPKTLRHSFYDCVILPRIQWNRKTFFYTFWRSKKVIYGHDHWILKLFPNVTSRPPKLERHELGNNFYLWSDNYSEFKWENQIDWKIDLQKKKDQICIHPIAEHGKAYFKNLEPQTWAEIISSLSEKYKHKKFLVVGMENELLWRSERDWNENVEFKSFDNDVRGWMRVLLESEKVICPDTAALHISAIGGVRTFSFWGGSSPLLAGYRRFNKKHTEISRGLSCSPCYAYMGANTSRVKHPLDCPDFICVRGMDTAYVIQSMSVFIEQDGQDS